MQGSTTTHEQILMKKKTAFLAVLVNENVDDQVICGTYKQPKIEREIFNDIAPKPKKKKAQQARALRTLKIFIFFPRLLRVLVKDAFTASMWVPPSTVRMLLAYPSMVSEYASEHLWQRLRRELH